MTEAGDTAGPCAALTLAEPFRAVFFETIGSTSAEAKQRAAAGAVHGTVIWAAEQAAGHGRRGRPWRSPPGNLYMSVVLRPPVVPARAAELAFVAVVALADAVAPVLPPSVDIALKWPNDLLLDGAKTAGILLEAEGGAQDTASWVVLGIGVNLVSAPQGTPYPATCLAELGVSSSPAAMLRRLIDALDARYREWIEGGFAPIRAAWLARARGLGGPIELHREGSLVAGRFADLDATGALVLDTAEGRLRITAGDVFFAPT
ncbi:MAG TPA: biotin--[acetyl-CoA-carboxylase] ligase [Stellaceae bacterium]|nr:biotin--[acetyl-CoA-carboxylase] ligase [Stellaceae bacterium]